MNTIYFQNNVGEDALHIHFMYTNDAMNINKELFFERRMSESIDMFLERLNNKVENIFKKKLKKKGRQQDDVSQPSETVKHTQLILNGRLVPKDTVFRELLCEGDTSDLKLRIEDIDYTILFNYPLVSNMALPEQLRVGCPVSPSKLTGHCINIEESEFKWFKTQNNKWIECGRGYAYMPQECDVDCFLKLECIPKNDTRTGPKSEVVSKSVVNSFQFGSEINIRQEHTKIGTQKDEIRFISYNILADFYTKTKEAKSSLFTYCDPNYLDICYRTGLIFKELSGYNGDVICLQEVEKKFYTTHLRPFLENLGFNGVFNEKEGSKEGCATFYNTNKFRIIHSAQHIYCEELTSNAIFKDIKEKISSNVKLMERVTSLPTQLQTTVLEWFTVCDELIIVGNTHLYFHPDADHIRLLQGIIGFQLLLQTAKEQKQMYPNKNVSIIFCGDFNSTPDCGIFKFMTQGSVSQDVSDWESNIEEKIENVSFSHSLAMESACGAPEFTNYTEGFKACLDYIYFEANRLSLKSFVPLPKEEVLQKEVAIPSSSFPSDHIPLIADLKLKS
ncbi:hypothetical protein RUM44_003593 [Polyplax serrata]|uniref:2',5'-phosphodiesterase 12 n=1 Tax=Polyplax serrata TaxID=468196 RepID=A0ABR1AGX3_POLSC